MNEPASPESAAAPSWERGLVDRIAREHFAEQRRKRNWSIFFKLLIFGYFYLLLALIWQSGEVRKSGALLGMGRHTAVVDVEGVIAAGERASADNIISGLQAAFESDDAAAIILRINSPGGSPVEAGYVNDEIYRLRGKHPDKKVYAVVTGICASGGYYIASAADQIYADPASIVGSIGVILSSFGFVEALEKLGIQRRLMTAGTHKGLLDPFLPQRQEQVEHLQVMLDNIHEQFIERVKKGRGDRLTNEEQVFSGLIWTGEQGVELGLVDALGGMHYVAREVVGAEEIVDYTQGEEYDWERLFGVLGEAAVGKLAAILQGGSLPQ